MPRESLFIWFSQFATRPGLLLSLIVCWSCILTSANRFPPFQILAALPQEQAPQISRELRRALAEWEASNRSSNVASFGSVSDVSLFVSPVPVSNDTQRILCDALEIYNPSIILSLLDRQRSFYAAMIAQSASVPFISLTQEYRQEPSLQVFHYNNSMILFSFSFSFFLPFTHTVLCIHFNCKLFQIKVKLNNYINSTLYWRCCKSETHSHSLKFSVN